MKKSIILFCLLCLPTLLAAQGRTTKSQSVSLNLLGIHYNYEQPLNEKFTVNFHAGLAGELGYSSLKIGSWYEDEGWMYSLRGAVGADFRYYYNLKKREKLGKSTRSNSGNFWAVDLQYYSPAIIADRMNTDYLILATPYWGIRRVYSNNLLFEFNLGLNVGRIGSEWGTGLLTNIKFGYSF
ncbi:hypothetical protein LJC57_05980 [Parabacteroides sp. OttesenSCG-928-G07]|nr:hypothetical protein [Parabacteroides sp. OttesenSCG-928-G21]MDL2278123.1 hypothetical protein [Parabacteroides sp. OttesenSCG-928-G07]